MTDRFDTLLAEANTPLDALNAVIKMDDCPQPVSDLIQESAMKVLICEMPKMLANSKQGPVLATSKRQSLAETYGKAMELAENGSAIAGLTATVVDAGAELAEVIDRSVRRIVLEDEYMLTEAHLDLLSLHAEMLACLGVLKLSEEQLAVAHNYDKNLESA